MCRKPNNKIWEAWWLNGSAPDCCPAVPGSNPASPQPTADYPSPGGLPPGMALGCGLTSVRGNRGKKNCENGPLVRQKTYKEKKITRFINQSSILLFRSLALLHSSPLSLSCLQLFSSLLFQLSSSLL
jgi:hypothetical protein